jgi:hypothetical protein
LATGIFLTGTNANCKPRPTPTKFRDIFPQELRAVHAEVHALDIELRRQGRAVKS